MREDDLCRHAPENEADHGAEKNKVVVLRVQNRGVGRQQPGGRCGSEDNDGRPLEKDREDGEAVAAAGLHDVEDAEGEMRGEEGDGEGGDPEVDEFLVS